MNRWLILTCLLFALTLKGICQNTFYNALAVSIGYDKKTHQLKDELPPQIFITYTPNYERTFQLNMEVFVDKDIANRTWPEIGKYRMVTSEVGFGAQLCYNLVKNERVHLRAIVGAGIRSSSTVLKTEQSLLKNYVQLPPELPNNYVYYSVGTLFKLKPTHGVSLEIGNGVKNISLGYHYFFIDDKNES